MTAFFTFAYNASATLPRTIESVLNQTCTDWVYYLIENGSTKDNTREIVESYAKKDSRIIPIYMDKNDPYEASRIGFSRIFSSDAEYFCMIDADDEYCHDFLEKSIKFMKEADLDIVACGNYFINAETNELMSIRKEQEKIILHDAKSYNALFHKSHRFMRTIWGKLYKISLFQNFDFCSDEWDYYKVAYGGDTIFFMRAALYAKRIGILNEALHKYYVSTRSSSYKWNDKRPEDDRVIYNHATEFLKSKAGFISVENNDFLDRVYISALYDTIAVVFNAETTLAKKLSVLRDIYGSQRTLNALSNERVDPDRRLGLVRKTLLTLNDFKEMTTTEDGIWLGINLSAMVGNQEDYIKYSIANIAFLVKNKRFAEAENELNEWETLLPGNKQLTILRSKLK